MFEISQKIPPEKAKYMNAVVLAYLGDAVHCLYVREKLAFSSQAKSGVLNKTAASLICATAQAQAADKLLPLLTKEESDIFRRAKNAKKPTKAKNTSRVEYSKSTGFEALIGYLYVTGQENRLNELLAVLYEKGEEDDRKHFI